MQQTARRKNQSQIIVCVLMLLTYACSTSVSFRGEDSEHSSALSDSQMLSGDARRDGKIEDGGMLTKGNDSGMASGNAAGIGEYAEQEDKFSQDQKGVLDLLLVIDNSPSMADNQIELANNLPSLLQYVSKSDWQIAVISTTENDCLSKCITKHTPNFEEEYKKLIKLGTGGSDKELYFYMAVAGLKGECNNISTAWLRDSTVAVLILGDEPDTCRHYISINWLPAGMPCASSDLSTYLDSIRPDGNAKVYGILYSHFNSYDPDAFNIFAAYGDISDTSYADTLQKISQNVHSVLEDVFTFSQVPSGDVKVTVNGTTLAKSQYIIDGKHLRFNQGYVPPENSSIVATYPYRVGGPKKQ